MFTFDRLKMCLNTFISKMNVFRIRYQLSFLLLQSSHVKAHSSVWKLSIRGLRWGCLVFQCIETRQPLEKVVRFLWESMEQWGDPDTERPHADRRISQKAESLFNWQQLWKYSISSSVLSWIFTSVVKRQTAAFFLTCLASLLAHFKCMILVRSY